MSCESRTRDFPSASFLRSRGKYHVQMFLQVRVDTASLCAPQHSCAAQDHALWQIACIAS